MKVSAGPFDIHYNKPAKKDPYADQNSHIREVPKKGGDDEKNVDPDQIFEGLKGVVRVYFAWKMADRVVGRILR